MILCACVHAVQINIVTHELYSYIYKPKKGSLFFQLDTFINSFYCYVTLHLEYNITCFKTEVLPNMKIIWKW